MTDSSEVQKTRYEILTVAVEEGHKEVLVPFHDGQKNSMFLANTWDAIFGSEELSREEKGELAKNHVTKQMEGGISLNSLLEEAGYAAIDEEEGAPDKDLSQVFKQVEKAAPVFIKMSEAIRRGDSTFHVDIPPVVNAQETSLLIAPFYQKDLPLEKQRFLAKLFISRQKDKFATAEEAGIKVTVEMASNEAVIIESLVKAAEETVAASRADVKEMMRPASEKEKIMERINIAFGSKDLLVTEADHLSEHSKSDILLAAVDLLDYICSEKVIRAVGEKEAAALAYRCVKEMGKMGRTKDATGIMYSKIDFLETVESESPDTETALKITKRTAGILSLARAIRRNAPQELESVSQDSGARSGKADELGNTLLEDINSALNPPSVKEVWLSTSARTLTDKILKAVSPLLAKNDIESLSVAMGALESALSKGGVGEEKKEVLKSVQNMVEVFGQTIGFSDASPIQLAEDLSEELRYSSSPEIAKCMRLVRSSRKTPAIVLALTVAAVMLAIATVPSDVRNSGKSSTTTPAVVSKAQKKRPAPVYPVNIAMPKAANPDKDITEAPEIIEAAEEVATTAPETDKKPIKKEPVLKTPPLKIAPKVIVEDVKVAATTAIETEPPASTKTALIVVKVDMSIGTLVDKVATKEVLEASGYEVLLWRLRIDGVKFIQVVHTETQKKYTIAYPDLAEKKDGELLELPLVEQ